MIAILKYCDIFAGSQTSVRAGSPSDIAYWILYKDNAINLGGLESLKNKFSSSSLTEDDIGNLHVETDHSSVECLSYAVSETDKEKLIQQVLTISEKKRKLFLFKETEIQKLITAIKENDYEYICSVHHID